MEIRAVRESEVEQMIELMCLVFRPTGHARYRQYMVGDPLYQRDQPRVVVVDGQVVATLRVWDRQFRVGTTPVRMGGIGNVCTHPEARGKGYATAMMEEAVRYMKDSGYPVSSLFTAVGNRFYHQFGYRGVPFSGFRMSQWKRPNAVSTEWEVTGFDEGRDLNDTFTLYEKQNRQRSGSLVRDAAYWKSGNVRARNVYPRLVARQGEVLGGYLTFNDTDKEVEILDVAHLPAAGVLSALAAQFLEHCTSRGIETIHGLVPQRHPFVDAMLELGMGNLVSAGNSNLMLSVLDMQGLCAAILPELRRRLDRTAIEVKAPVTVVIQADGDRCVMVLSADRTLQLGSAAATEAGIEEGPNVVALSGELFWRMLLGESGWRDLQPTLCERGLLLSPVADHLLQALFPTNEPVYWQADHF